MPLLAADLAEILTALKSDRSDDDNRSAPRVGLRTKVELVPYQEGRFGEPFNVWVRNVSATGMGLLHSALMRAGDHFVVRIPTREGDRLAVRCQVVHCHPMQGQFCAIGAKFVGEPFREGFPAQRLGKIGGPAEPTSTDLSRLRKVMRG